MDKIKIITPEITDYKSQPCRYFTEVFGVSPASTPPYQLQAIAMLQGPVNKYARQKRWKKRNPDKVRAYHRQYERDRRAANRQANFIIAKAK